MTTFWTTDQRDYGLKQFCNQNRHILIRKTLLVVSSWPATQLHPALPYFKYTTWKFKAGCWITTNTHTRETNDRPENKKKRSQNGPDYPHTPPPHPPSAVKLTPERRVMPIAQKLSASEGWIPTCKVAFNFMNNSKIWEIRADTTN